MGENGSNAVIRKTRDITPQGSFFGNAAKSALGGYGAKIMGLSQGL